MKALLVEDDQKISKLIAQNLKEEGFQVDIAHEGDTGLLKALGSPYDVLIVDIMLPQLDGLSLVKKLRESGKEFPILLLTARDQLEDRVKGLNQGADDYLTKPFGFSELIARVHALTRRNSKNYQLKNLCFADIEMDLTKREVFRAGQAIEMTATEFNLLEYFLKHPEQVITRKMISEQVWKQDYDGFTNVIDVYIRYLRKKIDAPFEKSLIHTVRGAGYILREKESSS